MRKMFVCALLVALVAVGGSAFAQGKVWDDLSWWGKSGATPAPVKDVGPTNCNRPDPGYWWWPSEPKSNANDSELWGNRGVVYALYQEDKPVEKPVPPAPAPPAPVVRTKPVYSNVLFDFDKAVLKPEGKAEVDKVAADLKKYEKDTIVVQGHTCDIGDEKYNMGLGQRRADAVKKYLVEQGIAESRISTKSFGETSPAVPNDSAANRKLNRRVMFDYSIVN
jgi:OOP family OmpA-OmpF porin